jgi:hypothetical protein
MVKGDEKVEIPCPVCAINRCPFCDSSECVLKHVRVDTYAVFCDHCKTIGPEVRSKPEAVARWNHRLPIPHGV